MTTTFDFVIYDNDGTTELLSVGSQHIISVPNHIASSIDPFNGKTKIGSTIISLGDLDDSITSLLTDDQARQQLLQRRARVRSSDDDGATWSLIKVGFVTSISLPTGAVYTFAIEDSSLAESGTDIFTIANPDEPGRIHSMMGGPFVGGVPTGVPNPHIGAAPNDYDGWRMKVTNVVAGVAGSSPQIYVDLQFLGGAVLNPNTHEWRSYDRTGATAGQYPIADFSDYVDEVIQPRRISELGNRTRYAGVYAYVIIDDETFICQLVRRQNDDLNININDILTNQPIDTAEIESIISRDGDFVVQWPSGSADPSVDDLADVWLYIDAITDDNPIYISEHPAQLLSDLGALSNVNYAADNIASFVSNVLPGIKLLYRIEKEQTFRTIEESILAYVGWNKVLSGSGEWVLKQTRHLTSSLADTAERITIDDILGEPVGIFNASEQNSINVVTWEQILVSAWSPDFVNVSRPYDGMLIRKNVHIVSQSDDFPESAKKYKIDGQLLYFEPGTPFTGEPVDTIAPDSEARISEWQYSESVDLVTRSARGSITTNVWVKDSISSSLGDVVILDLPYYPGAVSGTSPSSVRGNTRAMQILSSKIAPPGRQIGLVDIGLSLRQFSTGTFADISPPTIDSVTPHGGYATIAWTPGEALPVRLYSKQSAEPEFHWRKDIEALGTLSTTFVTNFTTGGDVAIQHTSPYGYSNMVSASFTASVKTDEPNKPRDPRVKCKRDGTMVYSVMPTATGVLRVDIDSGSGDFTTHVSSIWLQAKAGVRLEIPIPYGPGDCE